MKTYVTIVLVSLTAALLYFTVAAADGGAPADTQKKPYRIEITTEKNAGPGGKLSIAFGIDSGYHLDKDSPMKVSLTAPAGVTFADNPLSWAQATGYDEFKGVTLKTTYTGNGGNAEAKIMFAVCTKESCHLKRETLTFAVK